MEKLQLIDLGGKIELSYDGRDLYVGVPLSPVEMVRVLRIKLPEFSYGEVYYLVKNHEELNLKYD